MERKRREGRDWRGARLSGFGWNIREKTPTYGFGCMWVFFAGKGT